MKILAPLNVLETPRLLLRPMTEDDAVQVVAWRNAHHVASMSKQTEKAELTIEKHLAWFAKSRANRVDYLIEIKEDNQPIGSMSFVWQEISGCELCGELGKYIGETSALGKGYAKEAAARWLRYGFEEIGLGCVIARTRRTNGANININKKLGFTIQPWPEELGPTSDEWVFMLLAREDWLLKNQPLVNQS